MGRNNQADLSNFETCSRCESLVELGQEICPSCNTPTRFMSFKKRAEYEVEQWRQHKSNVAASAS